MNKHVIESLFFFEIPFIPGQNNYLTKVKKQVGNGQLVVNDSIDEATEHVPDQTANCEHDGHVEADNGHRPQRVPEDVRDRGLTFNEDLQVFFRFGLERPKGAFSARLERNEHGLLGLVRVRFDDFIVFELYQPWKESV